MPQLAEGSCPFLIGPLPLRKGAGLIVKAGTQVFLSLAGSEVGEET